MGLEELLRLTGSGDFGNKKLIKGKELAAFRDGFNHIEDLKPGDKVKWKDGGYKNAKLPEEDQVCEVCRVFPAIKEGSAGSQHALDEDNFSILVKNADGELMEYALDSRRFERVK